MNKYNFFISYRRTAGVQARKIVEILRSYGHNVFFDKDSIFEGRWDTQIENAIKSADHFIFINSLDAFYRPNTAENDDVFFKEIATALSVGNGSHITSVKIVSERQKANENVCELSLPRKLRNDVAILKHQKIDFDEDATNKFEVKLKNHYKKDESLKWVKIESSTDAEQKYKVETFKIGKEKIEMIPVLHANGAFYIGKITVTRGLWRAVAGELPEYANRQQLSDIYPITCVTYKECEDFVAKLNLIPQVSGFRFRLPEKTEWQYAAAGGCKSKAYTFAGIDNADEVAWHKGNTQKIQPAGVQNRLKPNELSIYDMSGNVWEWCSGDCNIDKKNMHYALGGSFKDSIDNVTSNSESKFPDDYCAETCGFRLVCDNLQIQKN